MIHVKRVDGQAACSVRSTASVWHASPMAESRNRQTDAGGEFKKDFKGNMPLVRIPTESGAILYEPSRIDHPRAQDFDANLLASAGRIEGSARGRGSVWFVATPGGGTWVLRHFRRGGLVARVLSDSYLWRGEHATRAFAELELLAALEVLGLPAVRPVAARYLRAGLGYRADLLTVAVAGARPLAALLAQGLEAALWARIGATIRAFHDAGVCHADLNAHNVLIDGASAVWLVDFDRGSRRAPGAWRAANLARLRRSLDKLTAGAPASFGAGQWAALLAGYEPPRSAPPR